MKPEYVDTRAYLKFELSEARKALKKAERNYRRSVAEVHEHIKKYGKQSVHRSNAAI
jgi:hypothetical protein